MCVCVCVCVCVVGVCMCVCVCVCGRCVCMFGILLSFVSDLQQRLTAAELPKFPELVGNDLGQIHFTPFLLIYYDPCPKNVPENLPTLSPAENTPSSRFLVSREYVIKGLALFCTSLDTIC